MQNTVNWKQKTLKKFNKMMSILIKLSIKHGISKKITKA